MPELKGRTLEEIDQLFETNLPAWQFHKHQTGGLANELAHMENGKPQVKRLDDEDAHVEEEGRVH